ncbi:hypothetical protein Tco_0335932 [Tanacetum coccineum]
MIPSRGLEAIEELAKYFFVWHNEDGTLNKFIKESSKRQKEIKGLIWDTKKGYDHDFKSQASSFKQLEVQAENIVEIIQNMNYDSFPSATETNPWGLAHAINTRSGLNYKPPLSPLDNFESSDDVHEISPKEDMKE